MGCLVWRDVDYDSDGRTPENKSNFFKLERGFLQNKEGIRKIFGADLKQNELTFILAALTCGGNLNFGLKKKKLFFLCRRVTNDKCKHGLLQSSCRTRRRLNELLFVRHGIKLSSSCKGEREMFICGLNAQS